MVELIWYLDLEFNLLKLDSQLTFLDISMISEKKAFEAMKLFLELYYRRAGNDMETLISDITLEVDGEPLDPAAWDDWIQCIRSVSASG